MPCVEPYERLSGDSEAESCAGMCGPFLLHAVYGNVDTESIYRLVRQHGDELRHDTLLHGDYCLPNVILDDWRFSGFVDLDCAGVGDRHVDVYWALWTLWFNLHTDAYGDRLLDAYGRDLIDMETLRLVAACEVFG